MMDQIIIENKIYELNTQWVRERRKYLNDETFVMSKKTSFSLSSSKVNLTESI